MYFEEALTLFTMESQPGWQANTGCHLGIVALGQGDLIRASVLGGMAHGQFRDLGDAWGIVMSLDLLGLVAVESGDQMRAAEYLAGALPVARVLGLPESILRCLPCLATLAAAAGRPREAARLFGALTAMNGVLGLTFDLPERVSYEHAMSAARERLGQPVFAGCWAAGQTLTIDNAITEALELVTVILATPRPSLTRRETDILHLLTAGMTDAAIADALFLSVRTAQNHVARLFAKLDVRSRAEAITIPATSV